MIYVWTHQYILTYKNVLLDTTEVKNNSKKKIKQDEYLENVLIMYMITT